MVYISEPVINEIKRAENEQAVKAVIDKCVSELKVKSKSGQIDKKYTRNILMALKFYKTQESDQGSLNNINKAIEVFKNLHAKGTENLW